MKKYDVVGIGNALMDFLVEVDDNELLEMNLKKGELHLFEEEESKQLLKKIDRYKVKIAPGGSSANTLAAIANFGGKVVFCGAIGKDKHGDIYEEKIVNDGVVLRLSRADRITGHAITFITPDSQRTFAVHLGAALTLRKHHVFEEDLRNSKILHLEGYQLEDKRLRETCLHAISLAKKHGVKVSIDLSDPGVIRRNLEDLRNIVKEHADIAFFNEDEAREFTGKDAEDALGEIAKIVDIAIVKIGERGSLIKHGGKVYRVEGVKANRIVDTTGAGDMYAAGILYGLTHGLSLEKAGKIASYSAAKVVEQVGARLGRDLRREIEKAGLLD
jgi:sugar/nucleoside kinase (ribokinase family)